MRPNNFCYNSEWYELIKLPPIFYLLILITRRFFSITDYYCLEMEKHFSQKGFMF